MTGYYCGMSCTCCHLPISYNTADFLYTTTLLWIASILCQERERITLFLHTHTNTHRAGKLMNSSPLGPKLVNFCQGSLTKHVECTSVCADDHPVENLLAGPTSHGPRGFRVEHFVRPPVHLDFHFLAPVDVACVVVKPALSGEESAVSLVVSAGTAHSAPGSEPVQVGRGSVRGEGAVLLLKNRVFERRCGCRVDLGSFSGVLGSRVTQTDTKRKLVEESLKDVRNVGSLRLTVSYFSGPRPVSLELVEVWGTLGAYVARDDRLKALAVIARLEKRGQAAVDTSRDGVMIYKASSRPPPGAGPSECTLCHPTPGKSCYRHSSAGGGQDSFTFTADSSSGRKGEGKQDTSSGSKVCLSLQRGLHVSCPASGQSVQSVWSQGELSKHGPDSAAQHGGCGELNITGHSSTGCGGAGQSPCNAAAGSGPSLESCGDSGTVGIPERFLDEITCEVMILPMLLPSGHVVDRSTLDKLHHTDSVYGRPPSDPFTGMSVSLHRVLSGFR